MRRDDLSEARPGRSVRIGVDGVVLRRMSTASWEHVWMLNAASSTVYAGTSQVQRNILAGFCVGGTLSCERPPSFLP